MYLHCRVDHAPDDAVRVAIDMDRPISGPFLSQLVARVRSVAERLDEPAYLAARIGIACSDPSQPVVGLGCQTYAVGQALSSSSVSSSSSQRTSPRSA